MREWHAAACQRCVACCHHCTFGAVGLYAVAERVIDVTTVAIVERLPLMICVKRLANVRDASGIKRAKVKPNRPIHACLIRPPFQWILTSSKHPWCLDAHKLITIR